MSVMVNLLYISTFALKVRDATLKTLREAGLMATLEDGRDVIDLGVDTNEKDRRRVVIRKSDGSSLYITRDIAAIFHR